MAERRALVEGLKPESGVARAVEESFVYAGKPKPAQAQPQAPAAPSEAPEGKGKAGSSVTRVPLTTRVRADYALALKRASLERQLAGQFPNTLQDILEEALQPWLRANGYLS
jgi:hypothetical protein